MDSPKRKKTYIFLIVINAVLMFFFAGMPKFYLNKAHFYENIPLERSVYDTYRTRVDIVLKDKNGKDVSLPSGTKIYTLDIYVLDVLGDDPEVSKKEPQRISAHCDSPEVEFTMSKSYLSDTRYFEDITRQELEEEWNNDPRVIEGHKNFLEYMRKERLWLFYPADHIQNYIYGLIAAVFSVLLGVILYKKQYFKTLCVLLPVLSILKITCIVYIYLNPLFCG
ncbi:MAG: hypothetical protein SPL61_04810 [Saccharofermentans sp.]|nr:hypothetical protein [Saccharofermentans sp.]